jgi:hypothetical protein
MFYLSARNSEKKRRKDPKELGSVWHTGPSKKYSAQSSTLDCPVVHRTVSGAPGWLPVNWPLSGKINGVRL